MCMVRSQKSMAGAVEVALGNAPYKIALCYAVPLASHYRTPNEVFYEGRSDIDAIQT
jgi:hypothetical protein